MDSDRSDGLMTDARTPPLSEAPRSAVFGARSEAAALDAQGPYNPIDAIAIIPTTDQPNLRSVEVFISILQRGAVKVKVKVA